VHVHRIAADAVISHARLWGEFQGAYEFADQSVRNLRSYAAGATKHRIGYIGHIKVQIMLLLDMTQYKVVKG